MNSQKIFNQLKLCAGGKDSLIGNELNLHIWLENSWCYNWSWYNLDSTGCIWYKLVPFSLIWFKLVWFFSNWSDLVQIGLILFRLVWFCSNWSEFVQIGLIWFTFGSILVYLVPFGLFWCQLSYFWFLLNQMMSLGHFCSSKSHFHIVIGPIKSHII